MLRDEITILPMFFAHYRAIGIKQFIIVDNGSSDGSTEFLLQQPGCFLLYTNDSFRENGFGVGFQNKALEIAGFTGWILIVDADEFLVYENMENQPISYLVNKMKEADTLYAIMLDVYPDTDPLKYELPDNQSIFDGFWFDKDYIFRRWPIAPWRRASSFFALDVIGGPRFRILYTLRFVEKLGFFYNAIVNRIDLFINRVPAFLVPILARIWPSEAPSMQKRPLNLVKDNFRIFNNHSNSNMNVAPFVVALVHIKFCSDLKKRFKMVSVEQNHYRRGLHYFQLSYALRRLAGRSLIYDGSIKLQSSDDLLRAGLIGKVPASIWSTEDIGDAVVE